MIEEAEILLPGNSHSRDVNGVPCGFRRSACLFPPLSISMKGAALPQRAENKTEAFMLRSFFVYVCRDAQRSGLFVSLGKVKENAVPSPSWLRTPMVMPWRSAISRVIASPSPVLSREVSRVW